MATYSWSAMANQGFYSFNPNTDFLFFDDPSISASLISVTVGLSTAISYGGKTVTLSTGTSTLTSSHISFQDGSKLIIGDDAVGTVGDSAGNVLAGTSFNDQLIGLGGIDAAVYLGGSAGYTFSVDSGHLVITDTDATNGSDGTDVLIGVESINLGNEIIQIGSVGEFQVNTYTLSYQWEQAVAGLTGGGFVVTWTSIGQDGSGGGIFAQRFGVDGVAVGGEFRVNGAVPVTQLVPSVAALSDGGYVIVWASFDQDGSGAGIFAQRYDVAGVSIGTEFQVNSISFDNQYVPTVAGLSGGGFVVAWQTADSAGTTDIHAQRFNIDGIAVGGEFLVNTTTESWQESPTIVAMGDGGFLIAWVSGGLEDSDIFLQRYDANGAPVGGEFLGNTTPLDRETAAVAALNDGGFVIAWTTVTSNYDVFAQRYDSSGAAVGEAILVNTDTNGGQLAPSVAALAGGSFVVTWAAADGSSGGINAQIFGADGTRLGGEFRVNSNTQFEQYDGMVVGLSDGGFEITWTSRESQNAGQAYDIYSQRFDAFGNPVSAQLTGDDLDNVIHWAGSGNVILDGGAGADTLIGGSGNDTYISDGQDTITEESNGGTDLVRIGLSYALGDNIENLALTGTGSINGTGNTLDNVILGNINNNVLDGAEGNDTLRGYGGNDTLDGGTGGDFLDGGSGYNIFVVDSANDVVIGGGLVLSSVNYSLATNGGTDVTLIGAVNLEATGNHGDNAITGNSGDNWLFGLTGADSLDGGLGGDTLVGGLGDDSYVVDSTIDFILEVFDEGTDHVTSSVSYALGFYIENMTLTGVADLSGTGNELDNVIVGNIGHNQLLGQDGNDSLIGGAGNDTLDGGSGIDTLIGGGGDDVYRVNVGVDLVVEEGGGGVDLVQTTTTYTLTADVENLQLIGVDAINATGNALNNIITGNVNNNFLDGSSGADTMVGGLGNDVYIVESANDLVVENTGEGIDYVVTTINYTLGNNVENLTMVTSAGALTGTGNALDNEIIGNASGNTLFGLSGNDSLDGGAGNDTMQGGQGNDVYVVDTVGDLVTEANGEGTDTVRSAVNYALGANVENLFLTGSALSGTGNTLDNQITGNANNNSLDGGAGNDTLDGGIGADSMSGGAGNDIYIVDSSGDVVTEVSNKGTDTVQSSVNYILANNIENLTLTGIANISGTGSAENNVVIGNDGANLLAGVAGNDTLSGGEGNDTLDGGTGSDSMSGGAGNDTYIVDAAGDVVIESGDAGIDFVNSSISYVLPVNVENLTLTGAANFNGTGNSLDNVITGNSGNNLLMGAGGSDSLSGGGGNDVLVWDSIDYGVDGGSGTDTLRVDGAGQTLNLAAMPDNLIQNIEVLDITGSGSNSVILSLSDVLSISDSTDTLQIEGNVGDVVHMGSGWTDLGINGGYHRYSQALATLIIDKDITQGV